MCPSNSNLKEQGKPEKVARIAAARKLLLIAHAIYCSGDAYRDPSEKEGLRSIQHLTPPRTTRELLRPLDSLSEKASQTR